MRADVHMHTFFSHDSKAHPEEMIQEAIRRGLTMICFTDHYDKDYMEWGAESIFEPKEYFEMLLPLQEKYKEHIDIRIGVELGLQPHLADYYGEFVARYPFDFVIGSVHALQGTDPAYGKIFQDKSDEEVYRLAFEETLTDIKAIKDFDVLGHLDYVTRYGKEGTDIYSYQKYADYIDPILQEIIDQGKGLEMNMAGIKYGLAYAHPHKDILKRYRELGGEILTVGADGHRPEHIAYSFDLVDDILRECGFRYYTEFQKRKPYFVKIG